MRVAGQASDDELATTRSAGDGCPPCVALHGVRLGVLADVLAGPADDPVSRIGFQLQAQALHACRAVIDPERRDHPLPWPADRHVVVKLGVLHPTLSTPAPVQVRGHRGWRRCAVLMDQSSQDDTPRWLPASAGYPQRSPDN